MERRRAEEVIKKGPWIAEEDEVLINFVKKNGPRDWSSIRSNGLLPRTGKSCRLRWVNKLRPNLKIGCKFSAEEERVVLDLQARFGNKWATIASYLPGRTDNDVKNFWSTRQKRLARMLRSPSQPTKPMKGKGEALAVDEMQTLQAPKQSSTRAKEEQSSETQSCSSSCIGNSENNKTMPQPDLMNPNVVNENSTLPFLEITEMNSKLSLESQFQFSFTQLPQPKLDHRLLPEGHDFGLALGKSNFGDLFAHREASELENVPQLPNQDDGRLDKDINLAIPDSFFDDFPDDMFDYIEPIPSSSAP